MDTENRIPTNLRTLLILEIMSKADRPLSPTEINLELGSPKQTVHRLCSTLEKEGFLVREPHGKRLQPSPRMRNIASGILYRSRNLIAMRQVLLDVANQVGETVNLAVPEENGMMYLDRVETDWAFRIQLPIGTNVPFHCTATGKCFLSSLSRAMRRKLVSSLSLEPQTSKTFTEPDALLAELEKVAKQGFSIDDEEFFDGMIAIAAPVYDEQGRFCAAIAFHGPAQRLSVEQAIERKDVVLEGAKKLGQYFLEG